MYKFQLFRDENRRRDLALVRLQSGISMSSIISQFLRLSFGLSYGRNSCIIHMVRTGLFYPETPVSP